MLIDLTSQIKMTNGKQQMIAEEDLLDKGRPLTQEEAVDINAAIAKWSIERRTSVVAFITEYLRHRNKERPMQLRDVIRTAINLASGHTRLDLFILNGILNTVTDEAIKVELKDKEIKLIVTNLNKIPDEVLHPVLAAQAYGLLDPEGKYVESEEINEQAPVSEPVAVN